MTTLIQEHLGSLLKAGDLDLEVHSQVYMNNPLRPEVELPLINCCAFSPLE